MFGLTASVGRKGRNLTADVEAVQRALLDLSRLTGDAALHPGGRTDEEAVDGDAGAGTEGAVAWFQRAYLHARRPDARVDPDGLTRASLVKHLRIYRAARASGGDAGLISFPLAQAATAPYHGPGGGQRRFRWRRSNGRRSHAGADLYTPVGTPVYSVAPGRVVRVADYYGETDHVVVEHAVRDPWGVLTFTCVYGELTPSPGLRAGARVARGERLGEVAQLYLQKRVRGRRVRYAFRYVMLHFELYTGLAKPLRGGSVKDTSWRGAVDRVNGRRFVRRADLADPTPLLRPARYPRPR